VSHHFGFRAYLAPLRGSEPGPRDLTFGGVGLSLEVGS
jgi:hypothetical protein